ncbi:Phosphate uptake regulator [Alteromonadaceae bacterium Bs31]|nr:Phosphate uptake regulator [Alteromonadaceae bacterium Bs31]
MARSLPKAVKENLHFLCVEVDSQLNLLQQFFSTSPTLSIARRIMDRSGYVYNLKLRIHTACIDTLADRRQKSTLERLRFRSVDLIATDLERIAELSRGCVKQADLVNDFAAIPQKGTVNSIRKIRAGVALIEPALEQSNSAKAIRLGQVETQLDKSYRKLLSDYQSSAQTKKHSEDGIHALFIAWHIKQMGETLVNISEALISANIGQPVNFERYYSLQSMMGSLESDQQGLQIEHIADTRSGSAVSGIASNKRSNDSSNDNYIAIFKDGLKRKVKEEREGVESWHEVYPGLAPKILAYKKRGQSAAILIEHLPGLTFEQIVLNESDELVKEAFRKICDTLRSVWRETQTNKAISASFMGQMDTRMAEVYKLHPEFCQTKSKICELSLLPFDTLVRRCQSIEAKLFAPFSVYIHGDFNVDNIIFDPIEKRVNFIDLHRSCYMDYAQDVSVFMVSNYRLQTLDAGLRKRIMSVAIDFYRSTRRYAKSQNDITFDIRLALGLARSFATSTRFILDNTLARDMFFRSRYLMEKILDADLSKPEKFKLNVKEVFVD